MKLSGGDGCCDLVFFDKIKELRKARERDEWNLWWQRVKPREEQS